MGLQSFSWVFLEVYLALFPAAATTAAAAAVAVAVVTDDARVFE